MIEEPHLGAITKKCANLAHFNYQAE